MRIFFLISGLHLYSKKTLYKRVHKFYRNCPEENYCMLNMIEIFDFEWDTLFVFSPGSFDRPKYQSLQDVARRIVFVKDGQIMYQEDELGIDKPYKVCFKPDIFFYTPEEAVFIVTQEEDRKIGKFYSLYPIKK